MEDSLVRSPAVAGLFYPAEADALRAAVDGALPAPSKAPPAVALVVPHAGYLYSGATAGRTYAAAPIPEGVVLMGPNHTGLGCPAAVWPAGRWRTPLGDVPVDAEMAGLLLASHPALEVDTAAHLREHALEVQLPFLQQRAAAAGSGFGLVSLSVGTQNLDELLAAGRAVAEGLGSIGRDGDRDVLLVVSSDMSHYISADEARRRDLPALERVTALDPEGLHAEVSRRGTTMCGLGPAVAGLEAARRLGAGAGELVRYGHSGEVTGEASEVVAYATVLLAPAA